MKKPQNLQSILKGINFSSEGKEATPWEFIQLRDHWSNIVGERLAEHTSPLKNVNKCLVVATSHPAFSQQLKFMEKAIIKKILDYFPSFRHEIKKVNFQTSESMFIKRAREEQRSIMAIEEDKGDTMPHKYSPEYRKLRQEAQETFKNIEDEAMRESMILLFIQAMHQKKNGTPRAGQMEK